MILRVVTLVAAAAAAGHTSLAQVSGPPPLDLFFAAASADDRAARSAMDRLAVQWRDSYTAMIIDMARQLRPAPRAGSDGDVVPSPNRPGDPDDPDGGFPADPFAGAPAPRVSRESLIRARLLSFLERQTGRRFDPYLRGWREWMWTLPYEPHPDYGRFKGLVYARVDPRMQRFFPPGVKSLIRLDEIDWGGVTVNGIPPLYYPKTVAARDARYLRDSHVVFGIVVGGEARAYPKRILAWHEMAIDNLGGIELTVVYCTLCGTVIPYESVVSGRRIGFGTSGLLYRSNKLMFDEETMSLWNTIEGTPVVGPLADRGLQLTSHPAVTTTWGEWRALHPTTTVLSLETGHQRDYGEGAAYRDYFAHDRLYFQVSKTDRRLKNKAEVLVMRLRPAAGGEAQPVAVSANFLKRTPVFHLEIAGRRLLIVTTRQGANRVYALGQHAVAFPANASTDRLVDTAGRVWRIGEDALASADGSVVLPRVVAHRAFWFGWFAQYPNTALIGDR
ncbi:MAG TPA: DUF3179 domain-containing (seleno)protein [Vicinamibacterales bacterium]|nr:DUF3179 domain-containing (seleno)protein [Vicinamibacterales bacterium]